jgi:hypothetical protein
MKLFKLPILVVALLAVSGCQQMDSLVDKTSTAMTNTGNSIGNWMEKGALSGFDNISNKSIRDKFLWLEKTDNGRTNVQLAKPLIAAKFKQDKRTSDALYLVSNVNHESNFSEANRQIRNGIYKSEGDLAAKYFVDQAKAQGHEVHVYKSMLSGKVNSGFVQRVNKDHVGTSNLFDVDPVFVEYDKNKRPVAIMTRSWQSIAGIGVDSYLFTNIYFGSDGMRWFENNFSNIELQNNLLRIYK